MIQIHIDPVIASVGPLALAWQGLMAGLGLLAGVAFTFVRAGNDRIPILPVLNGILLAILLGLGVARLLHVLDSWPFYSQRPWLIPLLTEGGMVTYGGIIGGGFAGWLYLRRRVRPLSQVADAAGLGLLVGHGIALIGELLGGEHAGVPSRLPWAVRYTHPESLAAGDAAVHPAAGYEMIWDLLFAGISWRRRGRAPAGVLFWASFTLYSVGRLGAGFFRHDAAYLLSLSLTQTLASLGAIIGLVFLALAWARGGRVTGSQIGHSAGSSGNPR